MNLFTFDGLYNMFSNSLRHFVVRVCFKLLQDLQKTKIFFKIYEKNHLPFAIIGVHFNTMQLFLETINCLFNPPKIIIHFLGQLEIVMKAKIWDQN